MSKHLIILAVLLSFAAAIPASVETRALPCHRCGGFVGISCPPAENASPPPTVMNVMATVLTSGY